MPDPMPQPRDTFRPGMPPVSAGPMPHEQIVLHPPPKPALGKTPPPADADKGKPHPPKDGFREIVETIVFVVVLVLLLKTFLAEAFVIPTGSMATTLLGYHKPCQCDACGYSFTVNCSHEAEPQQNKSIRVTGGICPNCLKYNDLERHLRR
jgi:hypothetical protein